MSFLHQNENPPYPAPLLLNRWALNTWVQHRFWPSVLTKSSFCLLVTLMLKKYSKVSKDYQHWLCVSSTALCGLVRSKLNIYTGAKGGSGTVNCRLPLPGNMRFFCKNECKGEDVLIKTDAVRATSGKYRTSYREEVKSERGTLSVTITDLTESDSGRYRCGLGTSIIPDATSDFEVRVSDSK